MKLLFSGSSNCPKPTFKRLLLLADEVGFMDRPSVTFGGWGTIGSNSPMRQGIPAFADSPVKLSAHMPPSGPAGELYLQYIRSELDDLEFRRVVLDGLLNSASFTDKFIQRGANYGTCTGAQVVAALTGNPALAAVPLNTHALEGREPFRIDSESGLRDSLRMLLTEISIQLTSTMVVAKETGLEPVADDSYFAQLLTRRTFVGAPGRGGAALLGYEAVRAVVPDTLLQELDFEQIVRFREDSKATHDAWTVELNRIIAEAGDLALDRISVELPRLFDAKVAPRLLQYQQETESIRDKLFGDAVKKVVDWRVPALTLAMMAGASYPQLLIAFAASLAPAVPTLTDYLTARREARRKNAMAYLVDVKNLARG